MKKVLSVVLAIIMIFAVTCCVFAEEIDKYIDNDHWIEISSNEATRKYNKNESFVIFFFDSSLVCANWKPVIENWMNSYN